MWSSVKLSSFRSDSREDHLLRLIRWTPRKQTKRSALRGLMKYITMMLGKISRTLTGEGVVNSCCIKTYMTCIFYRAESSRPCITVERRLTSEYSMWPRYICLSAALRFSQHVWLLWEWVIFNFPAQISLGKASTFSVIYQYFCLKGFSSREALLSVFVYKGESNRSRFCQQTKKPFNHRCGLKRAPWQRAHNAQVAAGPRLIFLKCGKQCE